MPRQRQRDRRARSRRRCAVDRARRNAPSAQHRRSRPWPHQICLGMAGRMRQRHEHPPAALLALSDVILDDRVAAGETVLFAKAVNNLFRRMTLLARNLTVTIKPCIDDRNERFQLGPPHRRRPAVTGGSEYDSILRTVSRDTLKCFAASRWLMPPAQARDAPSGKDPRYISPRPSLLAQRRQSGRLLRRPQQHFAAATVV